MIHLQNKFPSMNKSMKFFTAKIITSPSFSIWLFFSADRRVLEAWATSFVVPSSKLPHQFRNHFCMNTIVQNKFPQNFFEQYTFVRKFATQFQTKVQNTIFLKQAQNNAFQNSLKIFLYIDLLLSKKKPTILCTCLTWMT